MKNSIITYSILGILLGACNPLPADNLPLQALDTDSVQADTFASQQKEAKPVDRQPLLQKGDIQLKEELLFDRYTLEDEYVYNKVQRSFKWEYVKSVLAHIENMQEDSRRWGVVQNYKNRNGEAPLVKNYRRNAYRRTADTLGIERYQSAPLYHLTDSIHPVRYARDGSVVHICARTGGYYQIELHADSSQWFIPQRYLKELPDTVYFSHVILVDRKDQHIATLERKERGHWLIRSKNPATTGRNKPPYAQPTPLGVYLVQEQKKKMVYLKDGSSQTAGYAPYAIRFTNGAYIHGVPVELPRTKTIEYSWSLGTTPRSHMCVRNATSHAQFIYKWAPVRNSLVVVIE